MGHPGHWEMHGEKFAQHQLLGPRAAFVLHVLATAVQQGFAKLRVCGELYIQVLAPKRAQDATLSFPRLGILCAWDTTEKNPAFQTPPGP